MRDFYSKIASKVFNRPYEDCRDTYFDGTINIEGRIMRTSIVNSVDKLNKFISESGLTYSQVMEIVKYLEEKNSERYPIYSGN